MNHVRNSYLTTEVLTAAPQKLQLMLIEGALRFGNQARALRREGREEEAGEAILRCQQIVAQVLAGLRQENSSELIRRITGLYLFVHDALIAAYMNRDDRKLAEALDVLVEEQLTWHTLCEKLGSRNEGSAGVRLALDA